MEALNFLCVHTEMYEEGHRSLMRGKWHFLNIISTNERFRALKEKLAFSGATDCLLVRAPSWTS